ncbi:HDOD domain-containing protein [Thiohalobacter sp. IOR34]|uniref:HDOD domain-containing protein n=1 Tax=Thiohalobacter sp. IOR34 TaxID=3057176 RepID=UPI0025B27E95|nr:HDOD domain-containing protein [Thiohalobacter sp. IOR34]WJW75247.1 HDOD domain-containing protein [Thiohalobacter sp. IOR34]
MLANQCNGDGAAGGDDPGLALLRAILEDAKRGRLQLPSLPDVALRVRAAVRDTGRSVADVTRIVQVDPALATRLVQVVNSPIYRGSRRIDDCHTAITRLGLVATRNLVMSFTLRNLFQPRQQRLVERLQASWRHSCRVAAISSVLARLTPGIDPDRALLAGLVHDIGELPILRYLEAHEAAADMPLEDILRRLRGPLGSFVLQTWRFDSDMVAVPKRAEDWRRAAEGPVDYADIVQVAHVHSLFGSHQAASLPPLPELPAFRKLPISRLGPDVSLELLEQSQREINEVIGILQG